MNLIALDLSLAETGFAIFDKDKKLTLSGIIQTKPFKGVERLEFIRDKINYLLYEHTIDTAIIEDYAYAGKGRVFNIGELGGVVKLLLYDSNIKINTVTPTELKKFITGKGNAKKELMLLKVYKKYKIEFTNNNQCDAFALGKYYLDCDKDDICTTKE